MSKTFNEATRVQLPAMLHLTRLGWQYVGKIKESTSGTVYDPDTNILIDVFKSQFDALNPEHKGEALKILQDIKTELYNNDLGRAFYQRLTAVSPVRLIDFEHPQNNSFHFTAEFTCKNGQEEFRPDITLFVNGLPLVFVEVKKPNNAGGMLAESERMSRQRFGNPKFRRFINITQLMLFSNNMEYDAEGGIVPIQGAFYCTAAKKEARFNCFREENRQQAPVAPFHNDFPYRKVDEAVEKQILADFNSQVILNTPEYQTNRKEFTPTHRILTSMCSVERLLFILKYGIAYVKMEREVDGKIESTDEKHIMRYQQLFAALAIRRQINEGAKSGVVWHTQGSGKTALAFHLNAVLSDYFTRKNAVVKFYFIVDRLDLMEQATQEFEARGLKVSTANSREELMAQFRNVQSLENFSGQAEITVVNIQKFKEDTSKVVLPSYAVQLQRVFILDEAHRGYNPKGDFLSNLLNADQNAIKIALTGTPLLKKEVASTKVFSRYFHTYYYNDSIADGYTLKIIREEIETSYKEKLAEVYDKLEVLVRKNEITKREIVEHDNYVRTLADYIEQDLRHFRKLQGDESLGGMVICASSTQAERLFAIFQEKQREAKAPIRAQLILHDTDDKEKRKEYITGFKRNGTVDLLIVYNMLLTGFDAPRLKRLYFGRQLQDHNLLQAITRVNRPYKNLRYGYLIDFVDIKQNFEATNAAYFAELSKFNGTVEVEGLPLVDTYSQVIEDPQKLIATMQQASEVLFQFTTNNMEVFCNEISEIEDKKMLLNLRSALVDAKDCHNLVRTFGDEALKDAFKEFQISHLPDMIREVQRRIDIINQKQAFEMSEETKMAFNEIMESITFKFEKIDSKVLDMMDTGALGAKWKQAIQAFMSNDDPDDPEYITLQEAFRQRFKEHGFVVDSEALFNENAKCLDDIIKKLGQLQRKNRTLKQKYNDDTKFARIHKRISEENQRRTENGEQPMINVYDDALVQFLSSVKKGIDEMVYKRNDVLKNDYYFESEVMRLLSEQLQSRNFTTERNDREILQHLITKQYLNQYQTYTA